MILRVVALVTLILSATCSATEPPAFAVRCTDDSLLNLRVLDEVLVLETPHGRLTVPLDQVRRIEFATRLSDQTAQRIEAAVADLGRPQFKLREAATHELRKLKEKAYPALLIAAKNTDAEVAKRAQDLLDRLREMVSEDKLEQRPHDIVHTEHSKIAGRLTALSLRVRTEQFGDQPLRLTEIRSLRAPGVVDVEQEPVNALPDPGSLGNYQNQIGKSLYFRVTGSTNGVLWGTETYTTDSTLATAAVHMGLLQNGQTGVVKVTIVASPPTFVGSARNGVTSHSYMQYPAAFRVGR
ncbi:MAG: LCCL domain-containing protein [Gemmataceae bacterium]